MGLPFMIDISEFCAFCCRKILEFYDVCCNVCKKLPFSVYVTGKKHVIIIVLCYVLLFIIYGICKNFNKEMLRDIEYKVKRKWFVRIGLLFYLTLFLIIFKKNENIISFISVGQGDCVCFTSNTGYVYLSDCGSTSVSNIAKYRVVPHLKALGYDKIDYVIISHFDADHVSGVIGGNYVYLVGTQDETTFGAKSWQIEYIDENGNDVVADLAKSVYEDNKNYKTILSMAMDQNINIIFLAAETDYLANISNGNVLIDCLYPKLNETGDDINALSLVLSVDVGDVRMLLTGDIDDETESKILSMYENVSEGGLKTDYDILKVAHHGSKYASTDLFLEYISKDSNNQVAGICVGKNTYGHPTDETLSRLSSAGFNIKTTYYEGFILRE